MSTSKYFRAVLPRVTSEELVCLRQYSGANFAVSALFLEDPSDGLVIWRCAVCLSNNESKEPMVAGQPGRILLRPRATRRNRPHTYYKDHLGRRSAAHRNPALNHKRATGVRTFYGTLCRQRGVHSTQGRRDKQARR